MLGRLTFSWESSTDHGWSCATECGADTCAGSAAWLCPGYRSRCAADTKCPAPSPMVITSPVAVTARQAPGSVAGSTVKRAVGAASSMHPPSTRRAYVCGCPSSQGSRSEDVPAGSRKRTCQHRWRPSTVTKSHKTGGDRR
eukprot:1182446-Prorocentrum_minimum.AAC.1